MKWKSRKRETKTRLFFWETAALSQQQSALSVPLLMVPSVHFGRRNQLMGNVKCLRIKELQTNRPQHFHLASICTDAQVAVVAPMTSTVLLWSSNSPADETMTKNEKKNVERFSWTALTSKLMSCGGLKAKKRKLINYIWERNFFLAIFNFLFFLSWQDNNNAQIDFVPV